jgi:hypothetical protein
MPLTSKLLEAQALYYNNVPLQDRNTIAVVHLENENDERFWDAMIQEVRPGAYRYVSYCRDERGNEISGSGLCLSYLPYLSKSFFVCIDSDLRYIIKDPVINATNNHICQTYTYSWENHYCRIPDLQKRLEELEEGNLSSFSFERFISRLSVILFRPLLVICFCHRRHIKKGFKVNSFPSQLPKQCSKSDLTDDGTPLLEKIQVLADNYMQSTDAKNVDLDAEAEYLNNMGIDESNAYLHFRGHDIYDLINNIGSYLVPKGSSFEKQVLNAKIPSGGYWEFEHVLNDIKHAMVD